MPQSEEPNPTQSNIRQFWWCGGKEGCGHVVGEIGHKDLQEGGRVKALLVYETSLEAPPDNVPAVRALVITGYDMQCTIDHAKFDWYPSIMALRRLLSHYSKDV